MNYDELTDEEALDILDNHDEAPPRDNGSLWQYIEEPAEVLRWLDVDGDFEMAVCVQGLPPETPVKVARGLHEANQEGKLDLLAFEVDLPGVEEITCAGCGSDLYRFERSSTGTNWAETFYISEYGDYMYEEMELLGDPAAPPYWQADPDGSHIACTGCHRDGVVENHYRGPMEDTGEHAFRIFDGRTGKMSQYTAGGVDGTVIRDDWYWFSMDDRDDTWVSAGEILPEDAQTVMNALHVEGDLLDVLGEHGWTRFHRSDVVSYSRRDGAAEEAELQTKEYGSTRDERDLKDTLENWANAQEPHPDADFPYAINKGSAVWLPEENEEWMMDELIDSVLRARGRTYALENHRELVERKRFIEAAHEGTYAELSLSTGDVLVTGYEGEQHDVPHFRVDPMGDHGDAHPRHFIDDVEDAVEEELDTDVARIEWEGGLDSNVFALEMKLPEIQEEKDDRTQFIEAVEEDEYAELELSTGDVLITDLEGDGEFHPYVNPGVIPEDPPDDKMDSVGDEIAHEIQQELGVTVHRIEWDDGNEAFFPDMDRPE